MTCFVYHICREQDKYDLTKGYVGISSAPQYRWMRHRLYDKSKTILRRAYDKYDDIVEYILIEGSREYCLLIENKLRPNKLIGWNIVEGGGMPPCHKGKQMSQSQKENISKANSGINGPNWKGYWIVDGIKYVTTSEVAAVFNITTKTVCDRAKNPKFPTWVFDPVK